MLTRVPLSGPSLSGGEPIVIGLVNNMPDAALRATGRQFRNLLTAASLNRAIHLRQFTLPGHARSPESLSYIEQHYESLDKLWSGGIDGLIVTGTEPGAATLPDEPYWRGLTRLIGWADRHAVSTIWSCLAAHAAVLHLDGIERRRLSAKLFGIYKCATFDDHPVVAGVPAVWWVPHSRYHGLPEDLLRARGYQVLSRSISAGANLFIKRRIGLDVFFQGHPEYELDTLLREYRRDVRRFLTGEISDYPVTPTDYFPPDVAAVFAVFRERALLNPDSSLMESFPGTAIGSWISNSWRVAAIRVYRNWIEYLAEHKDDYSHRHHRPNRKISSPSIN